MKNNILSSIFSHPLHQESDQILHTLKPCSINEVARFFSLYDLQITERQKIYFLSSCYQVIIIYWIMNYIVYLLFTDPQFPIEMDPLKFIVSVIHNIESIQKGMDMKEAELSRKRELSETYKKISLLLMREIHAKEMQIKSMKIESLSGVFIYIYIYICVCMSRRDEGF